MTDSHPDGLNCPFMPATEDELSNCGDHCAMFSIATDKWFVNGEDGEPKAVPVVWCGAAHYPVGVLEEK